MAASPSRIEPTGFEHLSALIFDLDGTLIDSTAGIGAALAAAFQAAGRSMSRADLRSLIGPPISVIARRLEPSLSDSEVATIESSYRSFYDHEGWRTTVAFPGVADTLHELHRRGMRLFVVTNKPLVPTSKILTHLGLSGLFIEALTRDTGVPHYASKVEMLADLILRQRLNAESSLMIGDTIEDQLAAHDNGLRFLHVTYGYGSVPVATDRIHSFSEMLSLLSISSAHQT